MSIHATNYEIRGIVSDEKDNPIKAVKCKTSRYQLPPNDAVRVEEFANYFKYNYDQPTSKDPVKFTTEVGQCPWAKDHRLLRIDQK